MKVYFQSGQDFGSQSKVKNQCSKDFTYLFLKESVMVDK